MGVINIIKKIIAKLKEKPITQDELRKLGMKIGHNTTFYDDFWCHAEPYLIEVGSNCQITVGVKAFTHGGSHILRNEDPEFDVFGKVVIGDWCYIGNNSLIMPGVTIGNHVLVAAGSVVTKSIPAGIVVGGNPARYICTVEEYKQKNMPYNMSSKNMDYDAKKQLILSAKGARLLVKETIKI